MINGGAEIRARREIKVGVVLFMELGRIQGWDWEA